MAGVQKIRLEETMSEFLSELVSDRCVEQTNAICEAIGIDPDKIRYKRNSRYRVADRLDFHGLRSELKRVGWLSATGVKQIGILDANHVVR